MPRLMNKAETANEQYNVVIWSITYGGVYGA